MSKRQVLEIKGFDNWQGRRQPSQAEENAPDVNSRHSPSPVSTLPILSVPLITDGERRVSISMLEPVLGMPSVERYDVTPPNDDTDVTVGLSKISHKPAYFEEVIGEIDKELADNAPISNPPITEDTHVILGRSSNVGGAGWSHDEREGIKKEEKLVSKFVSDRPLDEREASFSVGWAEALDKKKSAKAGKGKSSKQGPSELGQIGALDPGIVQKKGSWTRLQSRPNRELMSLDNLEDVGQKRKITKNKETLQGGLTV